MLQRIYALITIEQQTRRVHLADITANPDGGVLTEYLIHPGGRAIWFRRGAG
jgi:hypothetical protein